jgi:hypothetical protein
MPIYVAWEDVKVDGQEKVVMRWTFDGRWTWSELVQLAARGQTMVASVAPRKVDVIVISGSKGYMLPSGNAIAEAMRAIDMRASNLRRIIVVSSPGVFTALVRTLLKTSRVNSNLLCIVSSLEEAYQVIGVPAPHGT